MWGRPYLTEEERKELEKKQKRKEAEEKGYSFYVCQKCEREFSIYSPLPKRDNGKKLDSITNKFCISCDQERVLKINKETESQNK